MKIIIDIGHPAHLHVFKHFTQLMIKAGHEILFTCRDKEFEIHLLSNLGFNFVSFGRKYRTLIGKCWGLVKFDILETIQGLKFQPDIFLSCGSMYASHAAFLLRKPHIAFEDTYNFEQVRLYLPFTNVILTSDYDHPLKSDKIVKYPGYHELAYLHPNRFTPDKSVLDELGISGSHPYVIVRFVSWNASHDAGHKGISLENKIKAVECFSQFAKVFISSESPLPAQLSSFKIPIKPHRMHDALAYASLVFGESSTMSEEAAMLGVPSIYLFNNSTYYTKHLEEKYDILFNYSESPTDQIEAINKGVELLQMKNIKQKWLEKREKLLADRIDVTAFLQWFIESYPESANLGKENRINWQQFK